MRLPLVLQWLRVAKSDPPREVTARRYAVAILLVQSLWVGLLFLPAGAQLPGFWILGVCELGIPLWAERDAPTPWHPHHIAERYGLFTIIALGESILSASTAITAATGAGAANRDAVRSSERHPPP